MNVLLVVCLVAVTGGAWAFRENLRKQPALVAVLIGVVVLLAVGSLVKDQTHPDLKGAPVYERSVGYALGQAAVNAFPDGGEILVIRLRFDKSWAKAKADGYVAGLEQGLDGSGVKVAGVEPKSIFDGAYVGVDDPTIPMPELMALLRKYPDVDAVVSFCGFPDVSLKELPPEMPPLLVAGTHSLRHGKWLQQGKAIAMVITRPDVEGDVDLSKGRPLNEVFDDLNYLVTADNLTDIARQLRAK